MADEEVKEGQIPIKVDSPVETKDQFLKPSSAAFMFPARDSQQRANGDGPRISRKVPLPPGYSHLDWMNKSGPELRDGQIEMKRYTLQDLALHSSQDDAWLAYQGRVYSITTYMNYHPGGAKQLMRGAGKECTELITKVHPWVNVPRLLDKCCIGYLVKSK